MPLWRVQVALGAQDGIPADAIVNDFAINDPDDQINGAGGPLDVTEAIENFYNEAVASAGGNSLAGLYGRALSRASDAVQLKYYNVTGHADGSAVGSPDYVDAFTLGAKGGFAGDELPTEVAACLTLRGQGWATAAVTVPGGAPGPEGDTRPKQRHSGRLYLGPLCTSSIGTDAPTGRTLLNSVIRGTALGAAERLQNDLIVVSAGMRWCTWSRADAQFYEIVAVSMDDAPDTVRSRGPKATLRDSVTF